MNLEDLEENEYYVEKSVHIFVLKKEVLPNNSIKINYSYYNLGSKQWLKVAPFTVPKTFNVNFTKVSRSALGAIGLHPKDNGVPTNVVANIKVKTKKPKSTIVPPKAVIAINENKTATHCVKCKEPTKEIALLTSMTRYCPKCE